MTIGLPILNPDNLQDQLYDFKLPNPIINKYQIGELNIYNYFPKQETPQEVKVEEEKVEEEKVEDVKVEEEKVEEVKVEEEKVEEEKVEEVKVEEEKVEEEKVEEEKVEEEKVDEEKVEEEVVKEEVIEEEVIEEIIEVNEEPKHNVSGVEFLGDSKDLAEKVFLDWYNENYIKDGVSNITDIVISPFNEEDNDTYEDNEDDEDNENDESDVEQPKGVLELIGDSVKLIDHMFYGKEQNQAPDNENYSYKEINDEHNKNIVINQNGNINLIHSGESLDDVENEEQVEEDEHDLNNEMFIEFEDDDDEFEYFYEDDYVDDYYEDGIYEDEDEYENYHEDEYDDDYY